MQDWKRAIRGFVTHGVRFQDRLVGPDEDQALGQCPFCGKWKFYVGVAKRGLPFECKVCGEGGSFRHFLSLTNKANQDAFTGKPRTRLTRDRKIDAKVLTKWGLGWDGKRYTFPITDATGTVIDLRCYELGKRTLSTAGANRGMLGIERLAGGPKHERGRGGLPKTVYLCEGEWDAMALDWLLTSLKVNADIVAVPGAANFKTEWVPFFDQRNVVMLYDHDGPGEKGESTATERLANVARSIQYCHWPAGLPDGFDLRDWIAKGFYDDKAPKRCWSQLQELFRDVPRTEPDTIKNPLKKTRPRETSSKGKVRVKVRKKRTKVDSSTLFEGFRKWLFMETDEPLAVMFGTLFANLLEGDPIWMFLVARPGGTKTELLRALEDIPTVMTISTMTPHSLVSGMNGPAGEDPSLIPKLDGKVLVFRDFTTVLSSRSYDRDEIFGQLREAYDGRMEKRFGNGVVRRYESKFGFLAGVTPDIDAFVSLHAGLGERFLKYRMFEDTRPSIEQQLISRAISNVGQEDPMRDALRILASEFAERILEKGLDRVPSCSPAMARKFARLAAVCARMRGTVPRDQYHPEMMTHQAGHELGTRLGKQLLKLASGVALYYGHSEVGLQEYQIAARVGVSSAASKTTEVIKALYRASNQRHDEAHHENGSLFTLEITREVDRISRTTVQRVLADLHMLGFVRKAGAANKQEWKLTKQLKGLLDESNAFGGKRKVCVERKRRP